MKLRAGYIYHVQWDDGSENLIFIRDHPIYSVQFIAGRGKGFIEPGQSYTCENKYHVLYGESRVIPRKNLPLYVSWKVSSVFTDLLKTEKE